MEMLDCYSSLIELERKGVIQELSDTIPPQEDGESNKDWYYNKYLNSEYWMRRRDRALQRGGNVCAMCGTRYGLHVHHISYERLGSELDTDLIVLCKECHMFVHGFNELARERLEEINELARRKLRVAFLPVMSKFMEEVMPVIEECNIELEDAAAELIHEYTKETRGKERNRLLFELSRRIPASKMNAASLWQDVMWRMFHDNYSAEAKFNTSIVVKKVSELRKKGSTQCT